MTEQERATSGPRDVVGPPDPPMSYANFAGGIPSKALDDLARTESAEAEQERATTAEGCARPNCTLGAYGVRSTRTDWQGYCSAYCGDVHDLEKEIERLRRKVARVEAAIEGQWCRFRHENGESTEAVTVHRLRVALDG